MENKETSLKLFNKYLSQVDEYKENVENTTVDSKEAMFFATWLLNKIQWTIREINEIKETLKRPILELWKAIEEKYKETLAPFELVKKELTAKQVIYQQELEKERIRLENEERERFEEKQKALAEAEVKDEQIQEIIEERHKEKNQIIDIAYKQSKQKWFYYDYEISEADLFKIDKKYLVIKPLEVRVDILKVKADLKDWTEILHIKYEKVWKVK